MKIQIKHKVSAKVLFEIEAETTKRALEKAVEQDAYLMGANLRDANLRGAYLRGADLRDADFRDADLRDADLMDAYLRGADLMGADLRGAYLMGANLRDANLLPVRDDFWAVLSAAPAEVLGLRQALIEGRVDGSTYQGECACLVGTIANVRGVSHDKLGVLTANASRPAERFFLGINKGDKPETNQFSKIALEWTDEWLANIRAAIPKLTEGQKKEL